MASKTESPGTLFENATVFDGVTPQVTDGMSVLVEGGEIKRLSARPIEVDGVERIDCTGKTLKA